MEREKGYELLKNNVFNENLIKHCLAVEVIMRKLGDFFNEDVEK